MDDEPGQQCEGDEAHKMEPSVDQREAVEHRNLIQHIIMTQGEEPRERLYRRVHAHHGEGGTGQREAEYTPQRTNAHRHAQRRQQSENKDAEADGGQHLQHSQQDDCPHTPFMSEVEHMVDIEFVEKYQHEEHHGLGDELAQDSHHDIAVGFRNQFLAAIELQLHTEGIGRDKEHEKHHHTRHENGGEIHIVVAPGIGYLMKVDADGLQERLYLLRRKALGTHRGLTHRCGAKRSDGLQMPCC